MTCFDFEERLQSQLDLREHGLAGELAAHAAACGSCRTMWKQFQRIETAVIDWQDVELPVDFAAAVIVARKSNVAADVTPTISVAMDAKIEFETHSQRPQSVSWPASLALIASAI